jgi:hypothetical protein
MKDSTKKYEGKKGMIVGATAEENQRAGLSGAKQGMLRKAAKQGKVGLEEAALG